MNEEITQRPEVRNQDKGPLQKERFRESSAKAQQVQFNMGKGIACPHCGTMNDAEAKYCASCGKLLHIDKCPNCGSDIDPEADFCEVCHHYIRPDVCSFCGAPFNESDPFCPECGAPRGGIVCPNCHTLNDFAFCKQCGQPLTDNAQQMMKKLQAVPEYKELIQLAREYNELQMQLPITSERDAVRNQLGQQIRERVLRLLEQDKGVEHPVIPSPKHERVTKETLDANKKRKLEQLTELLDRMALPPSTSPAKVRNYAMAQKPVGVRLAWKCNYKQALHSSPCGCAKPQMGGKWIVLGHNSNQEIKDDK